MLYDVYRLRLEGRKLPVDRLVGMRGRLRVERGRVEGDDGGARSTVTATLHIRWPQPFPGHAAATLHRARLTVLDERGFVLTGREVVMSGLGAATYAQAWFCRPVVASWLPDPGQPDESQALHTAGGSS